MAVKQVESGFFNKVATAVIVSIIAGLIVDEIKKYNAREELNA
jgi:cell division protein FtsN